MYTMEEITRQNDTLWVFGYGSLMWKTGFDFEAQKIGFIEGYTRKFWQGNTTHRGLPGRPGRVATLVKAEGQTWGVSFKLVGQEQMQVALDHLGMRECKLGGYDCDIVRFRARDGDSFPVLIFNALPTNELYLGEASTEELAHEVVEAKGPCGHNVEYVTRIADFVREHIPEDQDDHLFHLDNRIRELLRISSIDLEQLIEDHRNHDVECTISLECSKNISESPASPAPVAHEDEMCQKCNSWHENSRTESIQHG